jgi:hypothetical protein
VRAEDGGQRAKSGGGGLGLFFERKETEPTEGDRRIGGIRGGGRELHEFPNHASAGSRRTGGLVGGKLARCSAGFAAR